MYFPVINIFKLQKWISFYIKQYYFVTPVFRISECRHLWTLWNNPTLLDIPEIDHHACQLKLSMEFLSVLLKDTLVQDMVLQLSNTPSWSFYTILVKRLIFFSFQYNIMKWTHTHTSHDYLIRSLYSHPCIVYVEVFLCPLFSCQVSDNLGWLDTCCLYQVAR